MVESKSVVLQMIPHTLFIEWNFWILFTALFTSRLLFMTLFTRVFLLTTLFTSRSYYSLVVVKLFFTYMELFMYTVLFTYTILFIRPVFF